MNGVGKPREEIKPSQKIIHAILRPIAMEAVANGWKVETVSGVLGISSRTVFRWLAAEK
ncbi:helix-turn-helix domain-containing protein [Celerinatantimonas sp. YJH-8]|uniref:helix-turn-helix domain-containing protein n=1 Tax=Celerinatantimonas sp. YJH-8 TaxID=3228714 RepID=UPI0038CA03CD